MFTGIIQTLASLEALNKKTFPELVLDMQLSQKIRVGDSVAVNGACLTVVKMRGRQYTFDVSRETISRSNFNDLVKGTLLNIELPLTLGSFVSGHLVSGHLDGIARIKSINRSAGRTAFAFTFAPREWKRFLVLKGSVALNGISLTISEVRDSSFSVEIIPHTLKATNLKYAKIGERVNLELDLIGKYIYNQKF